LQKELARIKAEDEAYIAALLEKINDSDRKARSAEEYLGKREELLSQLQELRDQIVKDKQASVQQINELERQKVQDRCVATSVHQNDQSVTFQHASTCGGFLRRHPQIDHII
jgi:hypothetical protein